MNQRVRRRSLAPLIRVALVMLVMLGTLGATPASAAKVIFIPPATPSPALSEALVRVRGELASEGFVVEVVDAPREGELAAWRERIARLQSDVRADAVVTMVGDPLPDSVAIRVIDPLSGQPIVRRMSFQPVADLTAKALAIHTLELIRATFFELDLVPSPVPSAPPPPPSAALATELPTPPPHRVSVNVGATALFDLDSRPPVLLPLVQVTWALRPWLVPHLTAAGLGTNGSINSEGASAQVSRQFALIGAAYRFRTDARLRPFLSLSAGALHTSAQGQADPPAWAREANLWSFLFESGAGAWVALGNRLQAALAVQAHLAAPYPAVRFSGSVVKVGTRPGLLVTLTLGTWL